MAATTVQESVGSQRPPPADLLRPYTLKWFLEKYGEFTPVQKEAIPLIKQGKNVLITSPTGTGKTLAAFLPIIDDLYRMQEEGKLERKIYVLYVSPLRALNNDMRKNLVPPVKGIAEKAREEGLELEELSMAVRTGDTPQSERQRMLRKPPHILITTPESLAIILSAPKFRERLRSVRWVVIDEIHELASNKRGAHLALSLERLTELADEEPIRIGLSATIEPLPLIAAFLGGFYDNGMPRPVEVVDARFKKPMEIRVLVPDVDIIRDPEEKINDAIYRLLVKIIKRHRTTLVFTNTRSATERVVYKLRKYFKEEGILDADEIEAHHSSLSREVRLDVENRLKEGRLKAVVSSTSLELGIDIGSIDAVVLLSSPKSVTRLIQRVGRSGHSVWDVSKGYIIVVDRDDMVECTVLAKLARERKLDKIQIPNKPLDILAQHIVGMSLEKKWKIEEAYRVVKRTYNYRNLTMDEFMTVLRYLGGRYGGELESLNVYSKIWLDEVEGVFGRKKSARMIYYLNQGAIPDEAKVKVFTTNGKYVGDLEEEFVENLYPGDIFVLGGRTFEFIESRGMKIIVRSAEGQRPTVPSWFSEMLPLAHDSALKVGEFRRWVSSLIKEKGIEGAARVIAEEYALDMRAARMIAEYVWSQEVYSGRDVPSDRVLLVELWIDRGGGTENVIFHALYGRRVNDALARAFATLLSDMIGYNVRVTVTDNGFMLTVPLGTGLRIAHLRRLVAEAGKRELREVLREALERSEILKRRFRHCAERSFALLRRYRGEETSINRRQFNSEILLKLAKRLKNFPILDEAYREIMEDYMDVINAEKMLRKLIDGEVRVLFLRNPGPPTPFAHNIVAHGYSDIVRMKDRRALLLRFYEEVMKRIERKSARGARRDHRRDRGT